MSTLREIVYNSVITLHRRTGKEWISLREIYEEVDRVRDVGINNGGASVRAVLETHSVSSKAFKGTEEYILKEKGTGLYKSVCYEQLKVIDKLNIGEIFSRKQLMEMFKISGQSGIMKTNTLNCLVLITDENNGIYADSGIVNGSILYTGEGKNGDQQLDKNNKSIYESRGTKLPMYLFSKDKDKNYIFEGKVELYDEPYQVTEKGENGSDRLAWKFPLRIIYPENRDFHEDDRLQQVVKQVARIEKEIEESIHQDVIEVKDGPLKLRKYRRTGIRQQRTSKPDYIAEEIIKSKQGIINEEAIFKQERKRLVEEGAVEQVEKMDEFFKNKKENEGFDILSFKKEENGEYKEMYIEVKSTKENEGTPIDITSNEVEFAKEHIKDYYLYRIINSNTDQRYLKIVTGEELLSNYNFIPTSFKIYSK